MKTSYAPWVNFVIVTMASTKTVRVAPTELMTSPILAARRSRVIVCGEIGVRPGTSREATADGPSSGSVLSEVHAAVSIALLAASSSLGEFAEAAPPVPHHADLAE